MHTERTYAEVSWTAEDIRSLRKGWPIERCEAWLKQNERSIRRGMTEAGWELIEGLLDLED